ncbi:MAG: hypothetical protein ACYTGH_11045, partial [Planctomycetota bacterium]
DKALSTAYSIKCNNHLKQIGLSAAMYINIYDGAPNISYPMDMYRRMIEVGVTEDAYPEGYSNANQVLPKGIWMCPGAKWAKAGANHYDSEGKQIITALGGSASEEEMGLRMTAYGPNVRTMRNGYGWNISNNDPAYQVEYYYRVQQIKVPSKVMFLLDGTHRNHMRKHTGWSGSTPTVGTGAYIFEFRHPGHFNSIQWDGSARAVKPYDILANKVAFRNGETGDLWLAPHGIMQGSGSTATFKSIRPSDYP